LFVAGVDADFVREGNRRGLADAAGFVVRCVQSVSGVTLTLLF